MTQKKTIFWGAGFWPFDLSQKNYPPTHAKQGRARSCAATANKSTRSRREAYLKMTGANSK